MLSVCDLNKLLSCDHIYHMNMMICHLNFYPLLLCNNVATVTSVRIRASHISGILGTQRGKRIRERYPRVFPCTYVSFTHMATMASITFSTFIFSSQLGIQDWKKYEISFKLKKQGAMKHMSGEVCRPCFFQQRRCCMEIPQFRFGVGAAPRLLARRSR